jgi:hypothetical protein
MMAASPQVTARLDESTYKALLKLAELEQKTIADVTRELIQLGLGKKEAPELEQLEKVRKVAEATEKMEQKIAKLEAEMTKSRRMTAAGLYWTELLWRGGLPKEAYNEGPSTDFWRNAWIFAERLIEVVDED